MELSKSSDMTEITARLDRLERSVGKLIDVISQSSLVTRSEEKSGSTPLVGADDRMSAALQRLGQPEVLQALTRIASIAPQLEAAAKAAPDVPEIAEMVEFAHSAGLKLKNDRSLTVAADGVSKLLASITDKYDGSTMGGLDSLIPGSDKFKGTARKAGAVN